MLKGIFQKRIRYAEIDKMGFLYYGHYAQLYEIGRAELIRSLGFTYKSMEEDFGVMMPVLHMECRYRRPAHYDDLLSIHTILKEKPTKLIHFFHEIYNEEDVLINSGSVKLFFVDMKENKRMSCPAFLSEKIDSFFEKQV